MDDTIVMGLTLTKDWKMLWVVVPTTSWLGALQIDLRRVTDCGCKHVYTTTHWKQGCTDMDLPTSHVHLHYR